MGFVGTIQKDQDKKCSLAKNQPVCANWWRLILSGLLIFRGKKKQNFAGFSGANSRKNRLISRDFRGKKSQNLRKIVRFRGKKVKIRRKIGQFRGTCAGEKSKFAEKSADFAVFQRKKANFEDFSGANSQKNRLISREKFRGETSRRNNQ